MEEFKAAARMMLPVHREIIRCGLVQESKNLRSHFNGDHGHDDPLREQETLCDQMIEVLDSI